MPVTAVVGGHWGDEGKGKVINLLARDADLVIRGHGGANAGHTVVNEQGRFALHLVPAGIFNPRALSVIGPGVAVHPGLLVSELEELGAREIDTSGLRVSTAAHLVMPYHQRLDQAEEYLALAEQLRPYIAETQPLVDEAVARGRQIVLEGAHATLLDLDHGTYPYVTSSSCTVAGLLQGSGIGPRRLTRAIGVYKAYSSRVGEGPFPTELHDSLGDRIREIGHEFGTTTGRPRRIGWFDAVAAGHSARLNA